MSKDSSSDPPQGSKGPFEPLFSDTREAKRPPRLRRWLKVAVSLILFALISVVALVIGATLYYNGKALTYDLGNLNEAPARTLVHYRDGSLMGHVSGHGENRLLISADEVSPHFINALLAREDSRFYQHRGVDYVGVVRAMATNLKSGKMDQGASTITMQLARNAFEMRDKTLQRKMLEVALAKRIERKFSKDEILAFYMNRIYFGAGLYGVARASEGFFMKPALELTPGEGAMLAGIIRGPSLLNPFRDLDSAKGTRDEVIDRMIAEEMMTETEAAAARAQEITLRPPDQRLATGSYVLQTIYEVLEVYMTPEEIEVGGFTIRSTIDPTLQATAEKALDSHLTKIESKSGYSHPTKKAHRRGDATRYLQGAVVSIDNTTGAVLAYVGGRSFGDSAFNRAKDAKRQIGSTFKPFIYAKAMEKGLLPGAYVNDGPITLRPAGGKAWSPKNSDGTFTGLQPAAIGLIRSRNTMSVRAGLIAGLPEVRQTAQDLMFGGIPNSPVSFLGAFEATPFTLTSAYSTLATGGVNLQPYLISSIRHRDGKVVDTRPPRPESSRRIVSPSIAWVTSDVLGKVMDEGTGRSARNAGFKAPAYGKTGTTNNYHDAWFVGFTDKVTTGVWVGLDQPKKIMNRGYGSTLALPIWTEVMKAAETNGFAAAKLAAPAGSQSVNLCRECGLRASRQTLYGYQISLPGDMIPRASCRGHGLGLFARNNRNRAPIAFPVPGETGAIPIAEPVPRETSIGNALRGIGRAIFGRRREER